MNFYGKVKEILGDVQNLAEDVWFITDGLLTMLIMGVAYIEEEESADGELQEGDVRAP